MLAVLGGVAGSALLVLGWIWVSDEPAYENQTAGLNTAIAGVLLVLIGCGSHLWVLRRQVARSLVTVRRQWGED